MVKNALSDAPPFAFSAYRFLIAALVSLLIWGKHLKNVSKNDLIGGLICGFLLFSGYGFQNFGLLHTTASKSAFITSVCVLFTPILLFLIWRSKVQSRIWGAVLVATLGLYILINPQNDGVNRGDIITLFCALSFAFHIIFQDKYLKKGVDLKKFFVIQMVVVSAFSFLGNWLFEARAIIWSNQLISALFFTGILATFFGLLLMMWAQKILNPNQTVIILTLEPVFAALFATIIAGEVLGLYGWIGGSLVVIGVAWGGAGNSDRSKGQ